MRVLTNSETGRNWWRGGKIISLTFECEIQGWKIRSRDRYRREKIRCRSRGNTRERGSSSEARRTSTTPALIELSRSLYQEMERAAPSHHHTLTRFPDESTFHVDCNIRINFEEMEVSIFSFFISIWNQ